MKSLAALAFLSGALANTFSESVNQVSLRIPYIESPAPATTTNFTTLSLTSINGEDFTTLSHPSYPDRSIRIKKAPGDWCDPSVNKYTGYIDISPARHLFFYFFESRRDPEKDDVVLWTNGGPGSSSTTGLFAELGPCSIVNGTETAVNPHSWNELSNIFFIDQPIGTGYSYADYGEIVSTTEEAAKDIAVFAVMFFDIFESFKNRPFHLSGESYAGRYLPVYAAEIYETNKQLKANGKVPVNLQSVMIGNGWTSHYHVIPSYYDAVCTPILADPTVDIASCVRMKTAVPRCKKWLKESCYDIFDLMSCTAALTSCDTEIVMPYLLNDMNPYDVTKKCEGNVMETLCYPELVKISNYLLEPSIRKLLGVSDKVSNSTSPTTAWDVSFRFHSGLDSLRVRTEYYLEGLLDRGIDILIYAGSYDWIANWVGIENMIDILEWEGSEEFRKQKFRDWYAEPKVTDGPKALRAGWVKNAGKLTFLMVEGAGHLVPMDKPVESLAMLRKWLEKKQF